ncbi:protein of unknown function [Acetitomaculum ruminis DSM 5522]|uniref:DUF3783 domain-containing protein n=1 Tax=Acetitomaculum ruminis DSM 5522 TaxID=1120918 RepID=A0A1I0XCW9_9FIRM|nr:DUF3783 domain-containing protein [Acetitomaculum ruminis]SFA98899.1 protein of unknown function [Acetitomaculum ruminis DSM 5522]
MKNAVVLMYNFDENKGKMIKMLCLKMGIRIKTIGKDQYKESIGSLSGIKDVYKVDDIDDNAAADFDDEMLIMKGFSSDDLNMFLGSFKKNGITKVALKAIVTPTNASWNSLKLYREIRSEAMAMGDLR